MHVLTVTCWRDRFQFLLQMYSIRKFLRGEYKHFIVINDNPTSLTKKRKKIWQKSIRDVYENVIDYELIFAEWNNDWGECDYGWKSQQIYKFYYYETIKQDYVILDSKNFFVRQTYIEEFASLIGSGQLQFPYHFSKLNEAYAREFKCRPIEKPLGPWTPFLVSYEVLKKYKDPYSLSKTLYSIKADCPGPSEFMFYTYLIKDRINDIKKFKATLTTVWYPEHLDWIFNNLMLDPKTKIIGIHRQVLENLNEEQMNWLRILFFKYQFPSFLFLLLVKQKRKKFKLTKFKKAV